MYESTKDTGELSVRDRIAQKTLEYQAAYPEDGKHPKGYWQIWFYNNFYMHLPTADMANFMGNYRPMSQPSWDVRFGQAYPKARYSDLKMGQTPSEFYATIDGLLVEQLDERGLTMEWMAEQVAGAVDAEPRLRAYEAMGDLYLRLRETGYTAVDLDGKA